MPCLRHGLKPRLGLTLRQLPAFKLNSEKFWKRYKPFKPERAANPTSAMTNQLNLRSLLFLLAVSSLVSGRRLLGIEDKNSQNATVSHNYTKEHHNETELQPDTEPPQTTEIREDPPTAPPPTSSQSTVEMVFSPPSHVNGTSGNNSNIEGTKTNSTKHQFASNESLAGTESSPQNPFPENGTLYPTMRSSAPTVATSLGPRNRTNGTDSVPIVLTTVAPHMGTDGPSGSKTTVKPVIQSTTEIRTTRNHKPTTPHSTQKTDKSTTKVCPIAETKGEGLVSRCLIIIASLAVLMTIFIMTTIILATKLAGSRYRNRAGLLHDTEMVCISALMNDSDHPIPTLKRPKSNGALIPVAEDEDGDDLTLNSFLHDTEGAA